MPGSYHDSLERVVTWIDTYGATVIAGGVIASAVTFTPSGSVASTNVQDAVVEVAGDASSALSAHTGDTSDAHDASAISADSTTLVGTGSDVQAVLEELDNGIADHLADTSAAHAASAVSFTPVGTIAGTDAQTAIAEVATDAASALTTHEADTTSVHGITDTATLYRVGGTDVAIADGGTGASTAAGAATALGVGTGDSPQFTAVNVGHASDTTLTRTGAGDLAVEGNALYRAGGTDVPVTDGGTGASTAAGAATNLGLGTADSPQFAAVNVGHATDTTITRVSAGNLAVEGNALYRVGGTDVAVADGGTGASTAATAATNLGLGTGDSPQFTAVNIGHASDTTLARSGAGDLTVEGNALYRAGGTDVPVADGGTGSSTAAGAATNLGLGTGDSPQFTALNVGHASDSTVSRISAGNLAVEGVALLLATGWADANATWTYASADAPTFTFTISGDLTSKYSAGMRVKLTQTTVKYFIVTAVSYSSPNTTVTIYGGTDYTLTNAAISSPYYSSVRAPVGFPLDPTKWMVEFSDSTTRQQVTPAQNIWVNLGTSTISVPIGAWDVEYMVNAGSYDAGATFQFSQVTLSTANNSESDSKWTCVVYAPLADVFMPCIRRGTIVRTTKASYYLNIRTTATGVDKLEYSNGYGALVLRATSAYL